MGMQGLLYVCELKKPLKSNPTKNKFHGTKNKFKIKYRELKMNQINAKNLC